MANRLVAETSPYLLQHAQNPVDWWPWGPEAFAETERLDRPVLLSVGYAACHWCHVMAHESFEDPRVAALMNEHFVCIKVDREERPDVDAVYMEAVQAMTGQGGWPMTAFLTPAGEPFYCGTYFPPAPRHGMPSFPQVLLSVAQTWRERRADVLSAGARIVEELGARGGFPPGEAPPTDDDLAQAVRLLARDHDARHGGFGGAPKFPPSMVLEFLLRRAARTGDGEALRLAETTLEAMARGGLYDQLAGGFARYSVDAGWVVPHFEKMLYDNALLLRVYLHWWRLTGSPLARRIVEQTVSWLLAEMRTPQGGFASALDADSEGAEGRFYVWTPALLGAVLGEDDGAWAARIFEVTAGGTFEHGASVLQLLTHPEDVRRWLRVREALLTARAGRVRPGRDDKVVAAWNGLAVAALAEAGALLLRPEWVAAATEAATLLVDVHLVDGRLRRASRDGVAGAPAGVLEDYGDVAEGLLTLYAVTGDEVWFGHAEALLRTALTHFADAAGGFFDTPDDGEVLVRRPQDPTDGAVPSGHAAVAGALLTCAAYTGSTEFRTAAEQALAVAVPLAQRAPRFAGWQLAVAEALLDGPREVAVVGAADDLATGVLHLVALFAPAPGAAVAVADPALGPSVPLCADRPLVDGEPAAYVCRGFVCDRPTTDDIDLAAVLGRVRRG